MTAQLRTFLFACGLILSISSQSQGQDSARSDSLTVPGDSLTVPGDSLTVPGDSLRRAALPVRRDSLPARVDTLVVLLDTLPHNLPGYRFEKDSLTLLDYHHFGEVLQHMPGVSLYNLGNLGQPAWLGHNGLDQSHYAFNIDGREQRDMITNRPDPYKIFTEDMASVRLHPMHQAFWYGGPGKLFVTSIEENVWDSPRPLTRLRYTEASNEYVLTDVYFNLNISERENLHVGLTRTTIGTTATGGAARYDNNLAESWGIRVRYRHRVSEALTSGISFLYNDELTLMNGGIAGEVDSANAILYYPDKSESGFADRAFDPNAAVLINPTMKELLRRFSVHGHASMKWLKDSSLVSTLRVSAVSDVRKFWDELQSTRRDSIYPGHLSITNQWTKFLVSFEHLTDIDWAMLNLSATLEPYSARVSGGALDEAGLNTSLKGSLRFSLDPFRATAYARLDYLYYQTALSLGGTIETDVGNTLFLWGGFGVTPRPYSLFETRFQNERVVVEGNRDAKLEKNVIFEAGLRYDTGGRIMLGLTGSMRTQNSYLSVVSTAYHDTVLGRYTTFIRNEQSDSDIYGVSLQANFNLWHLYLDTRTTYNAFDLRGAATNYQLAPDLMVIAELYYRGNLIEGSLDLKAGVRATVVDEYQPAIFNPETDWFAMAHPLETASGNVSSYTSFARLDVFIYATIRQTATIHFGLLNALDAQYITTQFYPMYNRSFRLGVDWVFMD